MNNLIPVFDDVAMRFMDIRKRICDVPELGRKALMVAIPTTSGTGSEVTSFAVITDDKTHIKYPLADYALTPNMAIIDPNFVDTMPKGLCAASGIDALTHAIEAYVSCMATNFTNSPALEATKLIFRYLPRSYNGGKDDPIAREKIHYASCLVGWYGFCKRILRIMPLYGSQIRCSIQHPSRCCKRFTYKSKSLDTTLTIARKNKLLSLNINTLKLSLNTVKSQIT